ncbi:MAG: hypothetical protein R3D86_14850 [Emcibacteraceae bacterium]
MTFTYKKFTLYVMIFTVSLFAVYSYFILNFKMLYLNFEYPSYLYVYEKIRDVNDKPYNFIAIGDSRTQSSFMPEIFDDENLNSINFALGGASPITGYYTIKNYLKYHEKPDYILMGYSPPILTGPYFYEANTVKFGFLEDEQYEEIAENAEKLDDNSIIGPVKYYDYKIYTGMYIQDLINGLLERRWQRNHVAWDNLLKSKGHRFAAVEPGSSELSSETGFKEFIPSKVVRYYVEKTLEEASENNIQVFWFNNPINTESFEALSPDYKREFEQYMKSLSDNYDLKILNSLYAMDSKNFGDHNHVYLGAEEVTRTIKTDFLQAVN